jgi:limonene-1,2-epoxide hydrolase
MTPTETVLAFLAELEKPGGFEEGVRRFFTPETRYINVGLSDTTGIEETNAFVRGFEAQAGISTMVVEMLALAEAGNKVLTERIDKLYAADGTLVMAPAVMGVFEVADGKITGWRDYFDTLKMVGGQ